MVRIVPAQGNRKLMDLYIWCTPDVNGGVRTVHTLPVELARLSFPFHQRKCGATMSHS